jgi:signal transduction histidine kinase
MVATLELISSSSMTARPWSERLLKPVAGDTADLKVWRVRVLDLLLRVVFVLGCITFVPTLLMALQKGMIMPLVIDLGAIGFILVLWRCRGLPYRFRAIGLSALPYVVGVWLLATAGPVMLAYLFAFPVFIAVLLGLRPAVNALLLNAITILVVGYATGAGYQLPGRYGAPLLEWAMATLNFVFVDTMVTLSTALLLDSVERAMRRQREYALALADEQERLRDAHDALAASQKVRLEHERLKVIGQMASGIAHDINNAITPVTMYADELLADADELSPDRRRRLETIRRAIGDVAATVSRLREFQGADRATDDAKARQPVDLNRVVDEVVDLARARWRDLPQRQGIVFDLRLRLDPAIGLVRASESDLRDALTNLLFNALDSMPGGGVVELFTERRPVAGSRPVPARLVLGVRDHGQGMDAETLAHCFDPFFTTKGARGTGLGLPMVQRAAERNHASLEIDSTPGQGTVVRLVFEEASPAEPPAPVGSGIGSGAAPAAPVAGAQPAEVLPDGAQPVDVLSAGARPAEARPAGVKRRRIIVIDDEPLVGEAVATILRSIGHDAEAAIGGQAGIDRFHAAREAGTPFDLVVTDLGMPDPDGRRVCLAVKDSEPGVPVLMLTGWGQQAQGAELADRVLSKPPRLKALREAIDSLPAGRYHRT